jgi:hypothetical protein
MAAGSTYTPIATTTVSGTSTTDIVFSSISGSYTDLVIVCSYKLNVSAGLGMYFNTDTPSANTKYSITTLYGTGTSALSTRSSNVSVVYVNNATGSASQEMSQISINNYSNTTTYKSILVRSSDTASAVEASVALWRDTSAINKLTIYVSGTYIVAGSQFTLYGILSA